MKKMMVKFQQALRPVNNEEGAAAVEYGLLVALIAAVIVATVAKIGPLLNTAFELIRSELAAAS